MARILLGFDFGRVRIGVALGNTLTATAQALAVVDTQPAQRRWREITTLIAQWTPALLVVGRPQVDPAANRPSNVAQTAAHCEQFARQLAQRTGLPVEFVDESGSSLEAQAVLRMQRDGAVRSSPAPRRRGGRRPASVEGDDAEAAAVILRQYLSGAHRPHDAHDGRNDVH